MGLFSNLTRRGATDTTTHPNSTGNHIPMTTANNHIGNDNSFGHSGTVGHNGIDHSGTNNTGLMNPTTTSHPTATSNAVFGQNGYDNNTTTAPVATSTTGTAHRGGLFNRNRNRNRNRTHNEKTTTAHTTHTNVHNQGTNGYHNTRPTFGQWLKMTWLDIVTMVAMGMIGLGVYNAHPAPTRSFPVYFQDGEIVYPQFAYPLRKEIIPIWTAAMLGALVPMFVILVMQIRIRSFWDVNNAIIGLLYALINAAVFQVFLKWLIGGLRPHFLTVCQPSIQNNGVEIGNGLRQIMYDRSICTGDTNEIDDSLESFPSGHTTAAFAGFVFLYLYLNAKLKVFANYHAAFWKLIAIYAPILGAVLIGGALTVDEFHNWYDCLAGAIIGTVMAFSAYRMVYASVWDFRFNHIPLTRHTPFTYDARQIGAGGFNSAVFTRKVGWGLDEGGHGGAPFDAAHGLGGGMGAGVGSGMATHGHGNTGIGHHGATHETVGSTGNRHSGGVFGHHHTGSTHTTGANGIADTDGARYMGRKSVDRRPVPSTQTAVAGDQMV